MTAKRELASKLIRKYPDMPSLTLARLLYKKHRHLFCSLDAARCSIRYERGNLGKKNRSRMKGDTLRPCAKAGFVWTFPHSHAPTFEPFMLEEKRTLILNDLHIPFHSTPAIMAAIDEAKKRKPTCILLNGDVCDFFSISRFDKNPTESSLKREVDLTRQFLGWLRQEFPKSRIIYKLGNHDEWFDKYLWRKAPELFDVSGVSLRHLTTGKIDAIPEVPGIEWVEDQRKIKAGKLNIWHGHEVGKGSIAPPVNPARGLFMRTLDTAVQGHLHRSSEHQETTSNGKLIATWSVGCLCGLHPRYARINKWDHCAGWLEQGDHGRFSLSLIRILNGTVL